MRGVATTLHRVVSILFPLLDDDDDDDGREVGE
jgi:hypothetical protein